MLSTFTWTNRGMASDGFQNVFGANAAAARTVVDAALDYWERVITFFNYSDFSDAFSLNISMLPNGVGFGANAGGTANIDGKPSGANITIARGSDTSVPPDGIGDGAGWFLDLSPFEHSEFLGSIVNPFVATPFGALGADFLTPVLHEIGHAVGIAAGGNLNNIAIETTTADPNAGATGANLWTVDGNNVRALMTGFDTGGASGGPADFNGPQHFAPAGTQWPAVNPTHFGAADLMNATGGPGRSIPSLNDALMLVDAWDYNIATPDSFGTMHSFVRSNSELLVRGMDGNSGDTISIERLQSGLMRVSVDVGADVPGIGITGPIITDFNPATLTSIRIQGFGGNDTIRLGFNFNLPTTIEGGDGNDNIEIAHVGHDLSFFNDPITIVGGEGFDRVFLYNDASTSHVTYEVTETTFGTTGTFGPLTYVTVEELNPYAGSAADTFNIASTSATTNLVVRAGGGNDVVNVASGAGVVRGSIVINGEAGADAVHLAPNAPFAVATILAPVIFNGGNDGDALHIGSGNADAIAAHVTFDGGSGFNNTVFYHDTSPAYIVAYDLGPGFVIRDGLLSPFALSYANTQFLTIDAGLSADTFNVRNLPSTTVAVSGNGGNDSFTIGNGNLGIANADYSGLSGDEGVDTLVIDDSAFAGAADWVIDSTAVFRATLGVQEFSYAGFEGVRVRTGLGGSVGDDVEIKGPIRVDVDVTGGEGADQFVLRGADNYRDFFEQDEDPPFHYAMNLDGGGGFNSLSVDDAAGIDRSYSIWPDRVLIDEGAPLGLDFSYDSFQSVTIQAPISPVQFSPRFDVYGTSADIPGTHQMTILGTSINDQFVIHPHDAAGNPTINGNLGIGGGGGVDSLTIDDSGSLAPINYLFRNVFAGTTNIDGLGPGGFGAGSDVEHITINAGDADDVFNLESFLAPSSLAINGKGGVDRLFVSPAARNVTANLMGMASFAFDGGDSFDHFELYNDNSPAAWTYTRTASALVTRNDATAQAVVWTQQNVEYLDVAGSPQVDAFLIQSTPASSQSFNTFRGGGGDDGYLLGIGGRTDQIAANVSIVNDAGVDSAIVDNSLDSLGRIAHVDEFFLSGTVGDNLFAPGGYLYHVNLAGTLTVRLGTGADTVYVAPNIDTKVTIEGNDPAMGTGDFLGLSFGNVTNPVLLPLLGGRRRYTFDNAAPVEYVGMETVSIDATNPAVASQSYSEAGPVSAIIAQFSESVFGSPTPLQPFFLELKNLTTNQLIPYANVAMQYNQASNVATLTFPAYAGGRLPAGHYAARFLTGPTDFYGNRMASQTQFFFTPTPPITGDYDGDGTVGATDLAVWRNAIGVSAAGDGDADGDTDGADFLVWQRRLGQTGAAPATHSAATTVAIAQAADGALTQWGRESYRPQPRRFSTMAPSELIDARPSRAEFRAEPRRFDFAHADWKSNKDAANGVKSPEDLDLAFTSLADDALF